LRLNDLVTDHRDAIHEATQRLVQTVDGLTDNQWAEPSLLPGWTRAHVVAHLTLNAEGLARALTGVVRGEAVPMYASQEARDGDIEELATRPPGEVRERFLAAVTRFSHAIAAVPQDKLGISIDRTPGTGPFPAGAVGGMRLREVEIHHVDLGADYTRANWPASFSGHVIDAMRKRVADSPPFSVRATDTGAAWEFGEGGPTVSGTAADLAWWLTGRGGGESLTTQGGELPEVSAW
jgi:maleylpyruvate isomerase